MNPSVTQTLSQTGAFLGSNTPTVSDQQLGTLVAEFNQRFYQLAVRGLLFHYGTSNAALVAANAIATGVTATAQPVIGLYNPSGSGVILVPLKFSLSLTTVANTAVAPGGFMQMGATNQAITTGTKGYSSKSFTQSSVGLAFSVSTALTGLTGSLTTMAGTSIGVINAAGAATAVTLTPANVEEYLEGAVVIQPGNFWGLMNQVSTTTVSYTTRVLWAELPAPT